MIGVIVRLMYQVLDDGRAFHQDGMQLHEEEHEPVNDEKLSNKAREYLAIIIYPTLSNIGG